MKFTRKVCLSAVLTSTFGVTQAGTFTPVVDAPGADPFSTSPLGINDAGLIGGVYSTGGGTIQHGFVGSAKGPYSTFDYVTPDFVTVVTEVRALNNAGAAVGFATTSVAGITPQTHEFLRLPSGAITTLVDPSTGNPLIGIAQGINSAGDIVGDSRDSTGAFLFGFILSPGGTVTMLSVPSAVGGTHPRGINDSGVVVGFYHDANLADHGFLYDPASGTYTTIDNPSAFEGATVNGNAGTVLPAINNHGQIAGQYADASGNLHSFVLDATHTQFTDIRAPGAVNTQSFGINDSGQVTVASDSGGFIWSPTAVGTPTDVFLPLTTVRGAFQFQFGVSSNVTYYIDPTVALGYDYKIGTGNPNFAAVTPPSLGGGKFKVWVCNSSHHCSDTGLISTGGAAFNFLANGWPAGVGEFKLVGIPPNAKINPNNQTAFITGVAFVAAGHFTGTMTPLCRDDGSSELQSCADE